jgi:hypothetical protein
VLEEAAQVPQRLQQPWTLKTPEVLVWLVQSQAHQLLTALGVWVTATQRQTAGPTQATAAQVVTLQQLHQVPVDPVS